MKRLKKIALLTTLMQKLREQGSWCGETHVQKAGYILQELLGVPTDLEYILYKHGPFSFDLRDELTAMRADELVRIEPVSSYGVRLRPTELSESLQTRFPKTMAEYEDKIDFVAENVGDKGVKELERLATALYISLKNGSALKAENRAHKLNELKPHISIEAAQQAFDEADSLMESAKSL
ncbi:MAG: hypothetical protein R6V10_13895 [bacterium]